MYDLEGLENKTNLELLEIYGKYRKIDNIFIFNRNKIINDILFYDNLIESCRFYY